MRSLFFELILHIFLHITKLIHIWDISENMLISIFNHKFTYNTKMNKVENNKVKPEYMYGNGMMKG